MKSFDDLYEERHKIIRADSDLVRRLFTFSQSKGIIDHVKGVKDGQIVRNQTYFPIGNIADLSIGIDLHRDHNLLYSSLILANMRLVYEVSQGSVDLSRVFLKLNDLDTISGDASGIVTEDVTCNGKNKVLSFSYNVSDDIQEVLYRIFDEDYEAIHRAVFPVVDQNNRPVREVVGDLDHLRKVRPKYQDRCKSYIEQYESDSRFMISKPE